MLEWVGWSILDSGEFSRLQKLEVINCPKLIGDLPKKVPSLVRLEIKECPELVALLPRTTSICELVLDKCQRIPLEWQGVSSIQTLEISGFANLKEFASDLLTLTSMKELKVEKCPGLLSFSEGMKLSQSKDISHCYMSLERLTLFGCENLKSLPLCTFPKLQLLDISLCINFETLLLPTEIELQNMTLLESLTIQFCNKMVYFPCEGFPAPKLSYLWIGDCEKVKGLPEQMHTLLPSLRFLTLCRCPEIESFPEGGLPSKLSYLSIWNCKKLVCGQRDWGLQKLSSPTHFTLSGTSEDVVELFPEKGLLPSTLKYLGIGNLPNLKSMNKSGLQLLGFLEYMEIENCPQLKSLPEEGLPTSLLGLRIVNCPLLKLHCRGEEGEDWHKISHISAICIDGEGIFDQTYLGPVDPSAFSDLSILQGRKSRVQQQDILLDRLRVF
ncbi:hypothetical protein Vadar_018744 [Vaccinium darrowii]|uniref:Uncharacterized protein n=1 Tax=Vaccinium darrowii TaxID=229202 RepID=A0ACB7ZCH8_9ERIC|nr:hypothetical protein Vadar_018744 [Vaccinium darrowii]